MMDEPIDFKYEDTDSYQNEISEIYSYSEESEFFANRNAFEESMEDCGLPLAWKHMVAEQQQRAITYLMTTLEVTCRSNRIKSCRALAYLVQGNFGECLTSEEQAENSKSNVFSLYKYGIFQAFSQQLLIESTIKPSREASSDASIRQQGSYDYSSSPPSVQIFNASTELRLILAVLCTIAETMYHAKTSDNSEMLELRGQFIYELQNPSEGELLSVTLFQMLDKFCSGQAPHFPVRKITLLLWKVILLTLGGTDDLKTLKDRSRIMCNLDPAPDDTMMVTRNMTPCVPPLNQMNQARSRPFLSTTGMMANKKKVFKQPAFDDAVFSYAKECLLNSLAELNRSEDGDLKPKSNDEPTECNDANNRASDSEETSGLQRIQFNGIVEVGPGEFDITDYNPDQCPLEVGSDSGTSEEVDSQSIETDNGTSPPRPEDNEFPLTEFNFDLAGTPVPICEEEISTSIKSTKLSVTSGLRLDSGQGSRSDVSQVYRGQPWIPKVRKADLIQHLSNLRVKFLGYTLPDDDLKTTFGFPEPIVEGVKVLRKHLYVSLSEVQLEQEEKILKYPLTHSELNLNYNEEPAEKLYQALLPRLPQYMIALLKILLAASTNSKFKPDKVESINIMAEINPDVSSQSVVQLMKMTADSSRHEGVVIKAISAILLLLLKHFKINHVYQFEYVSQQLMFANCIPLILKFLSQDIYYLLVTSRSSIPAVDFPACVIGEMPELTADAIELSSSQPYCWRNMFSCINLIRVLNKLTKWKHSRIMMLVVFKSSQTLLKALNVRHPMFQLYILKLLKVQLKFLGRQWKKNNMKLIGPIYQKVRHRLTDDWAYSNDNEARPWDFQAEEFTLQNNINKFHYRRYRHIIGPLKINTQQPSSQIDSLNADFDEFFCKSVDLHDEESYDMFEPGKVVPYFAIAYEKWLENEVFQRNIDWDKLLPCC